MDQRKGRLEIMVIDPSFWRGRRVFLTGHTGFKGAWMSLLLSRLGAKVFGYALPPEDASGVFVAADVARDVDHRIGDIRDLASTRAALDAAQPEIVIHMAAQALVRQSYAQPVETYATNVMGTVHVLETARQNPSVKAIVVVTSDKSYENRGWVWGYRETDRLGGHDPYSNSKACTELVADAYRKSYFEPAGTVRIASGRAGNVIGGGDWARDRLIPDAMRAFLAGETLKIRNPRAIRPWQHVLDPVSGYLVLAQRLMNERDGKAFAEGWNFGPGAASAVPVADIIEKLAQRWETAHWGIDGGDHPHEAAVLWLDCAKAAARLKWTPALDLEATLQLTSEWYRAQGDKANMRQVTLAQIERFLDLTQRQEKTGANGVPAAFS
jgi:CDP-glucose 4,6-dehydratase